MSKAAVIAASLVDVRNIAAHKCVRLEIHVPAEQAGAVLAAFGWPTAVDPVPVAIARLTESATSAPPQATEAPVKDRRRFDTLPYAQQAAMRCQEPAFRRYLAERFKMQADTDEDAAIIVRRWCDVDSRSKIIAGSRSGKMWAAMNDQFQSWMRCDA